MRHITKRWACLALAIALLLGVSGAALAQENVFTTMLIVAERDASTASGYGAANALLIAAYHMDTGDLRMLALDTNTKLQIAQEQWTLGNVLTQYGAAGELMVVHALNELAIEHYTLIDMDGVTDLIDAVGGVMMTLDAEDIAALHMTGNPGGSLLDGEQVKTYMAERSGEPPEAAHNRLYKIFDALRAQWSNGNVGRDMGFIMRVIGMVDTNISLITLMQLGANVLRTGLGEVARASMPLTAESVADAEATLSQNERMRIYLFG